MTMLNKMNPKRDKLSKTDYMVDGQFVTSLGNLLTKDQTKELNESAELNEETILTELKISKNLNWTSLNRLQG